MENLPLKTIAEFCRDNRMSRSTFYNLTAIGRGPEVLRLGGRVLVTPASEAQFRERLALEPILGGVRAAAQKALRERVR